MNDRIRGRRAVERRRRWLFNHPLCVECKRHGRITIAEEVDHIVPLSEGGVDDESNLQSLCAPPPRGRGCHARKSALERGDRPREQTGIDGWPTT
jgi:5-methylcytosine-specific restriction protein A